MNVAVIRGHLSRDPDLRELPSGSWVANLDVTVRDVSPAETVPVAWVDPPRSWQRLAAGDEVVVAGRVRRRFFRTANGPGSRTELLAERVVPARQATRVRAVLDQAVARLDAVTG